MYCKSKILGLSVCVILTSLMVSGCATTQSATKYSQSEVKLIPIIAIQKVLSSSATNETVKVNASSIDGPAEVKRIESQKYVIVTDKRGNEIKLMISEITEIERIRWKRKPDTNASLEENRSNNAEAVGEALIYAPLVPVAIVSIPFLSAMGLDAKKNAEDNQKARLVYEGMSKKDLMTHLGKPKEKYYCDDRRGSPPYEIWVYEKSKVLRGGRSLFINLEKDSVYHNSYGTSFFKDSNACSLITK